MQKNDYEEYELGRDVTHLATSGRKKDTCIISVRMAGSEIAKLEGIGRESGKTVAQVVRDAVAAYQVNRPMLMADANGVTVSIGLHRNASHNALRQVTLFPASASITGAMAPLQTAT